MPWIIDKDHVGDSNSKPGTLQNALGLVGPSSYDGNGAELTHKFQMRDDDGELCYEGRSADPDDFGPLDDFGMPNAGATQIAYLNPTTGKFETL